MKDELRRRMKTTRENFRGAPRAAADELIKKRFLAEYGGFNDYFVYNAFGSEADTRGIIGGLITLGKRVYLPRVEGETMFPVPYGPTKKGAFGVEEPLGQAYTGKIDVVVTPLLAVNGRGFRTGYGKGFYDGYFRRNAALRVGIGYEFQRGEFTEDGWDEPLDAFISEKGIIFYGKKDGRG